MPDPLSRLRRLVRRHRVDDNVAGTGHVVVRLSGEITARNAERVAERLRQALRTHPQVLEVDLWRVPHLSSDGCAAFFAALLAARPQATRVTVTHANARAHDTLTQLGLARFLDLRREEDQDSP
ncbi:STAS domain-containing protein [Streptomyces sp. NPDC048581]|uniref:STAS domain-containing protein n=1 Tax=Streptomyces sp. NPDC048581 TaxID=3365572 RepID=UPI0037157D37